MEERLQKVLSQWGIASRRHAEVLIQSGRVVVNGNVAQLGQKADPVNDHIELDGKVLSAQNRPAHHYFLLNKPKRVMSSCHDPQGRKTVLAFLPEALRQGEGMHPVGRLDFNSTGALLLTNDGELTYRLTHPRHHIPKTYRVVVAGQPSPAIIRRWQQGIVLSGHRTLPAKVDVVSTGLSKCTELEVVLWEGRNRQIRRVAEYLGHPVKRLHRIAIGPIQLGNLATGQGRALTLVELTQLREALDGILTPQGASQETKLPRY
ncbi:MAG: rRNA pseudouridine synthase [Leptolyngbya sp. SIO1D8]|nr:rRNA pseudouridine synthase [Leptolyngbya sp. SIO1D8]